MTQEQSATAGRSSANVPPNIESLAKDVLSRIARDLETRKPSSFDASIETNQDRLQNLELEGAHTNVDDVHVTLLAQGGYNDVWLVRSSQPPFVLRVPNDDSLKPHQIQNEVGWLAYVAKKCPEIPVPVVYDYSDGSSGNDTAFIAEQYVEAKSLSNAWSAYTQSEKEEVARKVAELIVGMGELRFDAIGGMTPDGTVGPTVEGCKLFKGRDAFHRTDCYDVGPYYSIQQYILAYYDKEIHYYSHADAEVLDQDLFEDTTVADLVETLKEKRAAVEVDLKANARSEPFALCHNDLQGRNILMRGTDIAAVIDWEFAGAYPLSELQDTGFEVLEMVDEESEEECMKWGDKVSELVKQIAKERNWKANDVQLLVGGGDPVLQAVRIEMVPEMKDDVV